MTSHTGHEADRMDSEGLLRASREGDEAKVKDILENGKQVDVNFTGSSNWNRDWSALHLASYFGHLGVVRILLEHGANVDILNGMGDTALHKASLTGREDVASLLLQHDADAHLINSEGYEPHHLAQANSVKVLLEAAAKLHEKRIEEELLNAARDGDVDKINSLLKGPYPPQINCTDGAGNTPLHNAAYRSHLTVVIVLLQHGVDITIKNNRGHTANELAHSIEVKKLLGVRPAKEIRQHATKFEGQLLKNRVFFGFKPVWVVLEHGALLVYSTKKSGERRLVALKHLAESQICSKVDDPYSFMVQFRDRSVFLFKVLSDAAYEIERQRWINSLKDHRDYTSIDLHTSSRPDIETIGNLEANLRKAEAQQQVLEQKLDAARSLLEQLSSENSRSKATNLAAAAVYTEKFSEISQVASDLTVALGHCVGLVAVQEEIYRIGAEHEAEEKRVLEESVHALALQNESLKESVGTDSLLLFYNRQETRDSKQEAMMEGKGVERFEESGSDSDEFFDTRSEFSRSQSRRSSSTPFDKPFLDCETSLSSTASCYRTILPAVMPSANISLWMVIKHCIGRDMSRITLPVFVNEPLSFLQRTAEALEYCYLIDKAVACDCPLERMKHVAAFVVSTLVCCHERTWKPFNPLLGETYELTRNDMGFRMVLEQVSHHPPITAIHCESQEYTLHAFVQARIQMTAHGLNVTSQGFTTLHLLKYDEVYMWEFPDAVVHNLIIGKMWVERMGVIEVKNVTRGHRAVLDFKKSGWFNKHIHNVEGLIQSPEKETKSRLEGKWTEEIRCIAVPADDGSSATTQKKDGDGVEERDDASECNVIWRVEPRPEKASEMYNMSKFAMSLNELTEENGPMLAPTDSRLRPDIRLMEDGDIKSAGDEKHRLEEKQRAARRKRHDAKEEWVPRWFRKEAIPHTGEMGWVLVESPSYWERDFSRCPDIY